MSKHIENDLDSFSEDDSSVGSLVDFIVEDTEDEFENTENTNEDVIESITKQYSEVQDLGTNVDTNGVRRSTRNNKGVAPERYVDENYADLMIDDDDDITVLITDELLEQIDREENNATFNNNDDEYEYVSDIEEESEDDYEYSESESDGNEEDEENDESE